MADTQTDRAKPPRMKMWLRVLLFGSLALNLAVAGVVAGAVWRHADRDGDRRSPRADRISVAYIRALSDADKKAIRDEMRARLPGRAALRAQLRDSFGPVLQALRAEQFDRENLAALMQDQFAIGADQQRMARSLMLDRLAAHSLEERRAFADRLEQELARMAQRGGKRRAHNNED